MPCKQVVDDYANWFYGTFLPTVCACLDHPKSQTGYFQSILDVSVENAPCTRVYSVVVHFLGRKSWCELAMARLKWLAVEFSCGMRRFLLAGSGDRLAAL